MAVQIPFPLPATGYALNSKVRVNLDFLVAQFNEFNSGTATWDNVSIGTANNLTGTLTFYNANNANYLTFQPGATGSNTTYTLPIALPSGQGVLKTTNAGVMSWLEGTGIPYESSGTYGFSGAAAVSRAVVMIGTAGVPVIADHSYDVTNADNGLLYIASGTSVDALGNSTGTDAIVRGGSSGTPEYVTLLGTSNQISVAHNSGNTTLSTPQDIGTGSNLIFNRVRVAAGSYASPGFYFESSTANTVGLFAEGNGTALYVRAGGASDSTVFAVDSTGLAIASGSGSEFRAEVLRALTALQITTDVGTVTIESTGSTSYTLTLPPDDGDSNEVLSTNGSGVLSWVSISGAGAANTALSNLASVAINTTLVSDTNNTDDLGTSSIRWKTGYFATSLDISATSNQVVIGTTRTVTLTAPTPASASRTVTFPDLSADYSVVGTAGTQTISGTKTFDGQLIGKGTATNDDAASGYIGEVARSQQGSTAFPTSTQFGDLTSISLTAGDWDIDAVLAYQPNGATGTNFTIGISPNSGNDSTGLTIGDNRGTCSFASAVPSTLTIAGYRVSLTSTTTYYLKYAATYSVGTPNGTGRISARRVR